MNKFQGILSEENMNVVVTVMSVVDSIPEKQMINLVESVCNVVYCHENYFDTLSVDDKIKSITMVALTFNILLDEEINPSAKKYFTLGINAFNNNIFSVGGANYVQ